ncbi:MAG: putative addiction module component family protein [Mucilaginibacter sp.]|nr:putative addiction module component family protein [Mucilaginibacter sp.]
MKVQYVSDEKGRVTAVQVPIEEWDLIKSKYPDVDNIDTSLPPWQKDLIDARLDDLKNNPDRIRPISELFEELDK